MATTLENGKITGVVGIVAAVAYVLCMFAAAFLTDGFDFGTGGLSDLSSEMIYIVGCVVAGALGVLFGVLVSMRKAKSKTFIEKIRSVLMIATGLVLVAMGVLDIEGLEWAFIALVCLTVLADVGYDWVTDQKVLMIISAAFLLVIVLTGVLSQGDNKIISVMFALLVAAWVLFVAAMYFAPVVETPVKGVSKPKETDKSKGKKNAPAPRPYPAKRPEAEAQQKKAEEPPKPVVREQPKKAEVPVAVPKKAEEPPVVVREEPKRAEEPPVVKEPPKKVEPQPEPKKEEELPKLKVMSSREAALARESARKKEPEPEQGLKETGPPEVQPAVEPSPTEETDIDADDEYEEDFEMFEDTPDALLRRATWNKGLRCRRDYGEYQVPIAFVKAKVAVYVVPEFGSTPDDDALRAEGWTVFRYLESEITDGKDQAEEINKAVKDNLRAERAAKKKKTKK
jgi:Predicted membrane protein